MDLNLLPVGMRGYQTAREPFKLPPSLNKMVQQSEKLSADFNAVRVDFYNCNGKVYFSEITHYHGSGLVGFEPESISPTLALSSVRESNIRSLITNPGKFRLLNKQIHQPGCY